MPINTDQLKNGHLTAKDAGTLIRFGGAIKALGDGKFEGPLISFGDEDATDLVRDFFVEETKFWKDFPCSVPLLYAHGMDDTMEDRELGVKSAPGAQLELRDVGVWMQGQLDLADEYEAAVYGLIEAGKCGSSSGAVAHLVKRQEVKATDGTSSHKITSWPLFEASLTPQPCESRNRIAPLKSLPALLGQKPAPIPKPEVIAPAVKSALKPERRAELKATLLGDGIEGDMTMSAIGRLNDALMYRVVRVIIDPDDDYYDNALLAALGVDEETPMSERITLMSAAFDEFRDLAMNAIEAILGGTDMEDPAAAIKSLELLYTDPASATLPAGTTWAKQAELTLTSVQALTERTRAIAALRAQDSARVKSGRILSEATRARLQTHLDTLRGSCTDMADLLESATPEAGKTVPPTPEAGKSAPAIAPSAEAAGVAYTQFLREQSRSLGA